MIYIDLAERSNYPLRGNTFPVPGTRRYTAAVGRVETPQASYGLVWKPSQYLYVFVL